MEINDITGDVLDAAVKLHKLFGPGLFESVYERLLKIELERRGHEVRRQVPVSFVYGGVCFENAFGIDLLVDGEVVLELKSVASMNPVFAKQLKTYLVLTRLHPQQRQTVSVSPRLRVMTRLHPQQRQTVSVSPRLRVSNHLPERKTQK